LFRRPSLSLPELPRTIFGKNRGGKKIFGGDDKEKEDVDEKDDKDEDAVPFTVIRVSSSVSQVINKRSH